MAESRRLAYMVLISGLLAGCRCCPLTTHYANAVDDINDTHLYFDNWYNPRLDVSRAGKPDWCGPFNQRFLCNCCYLGSWDQYDDCHLYPPHHPYQFPSLTFIPHASANSLPQPPEPDAEPAAESLMVP